MLFSPALGSHVEIYLRSGSVGGIKFGVYCAPINKPEHTAGSGASHCSNVVMPACKTQVSAHNVFLIALLCLRLRASTST